MGNIVDAVQVLYSFLIEHVLPLGSHYFMGSAAKKTSQEGLEIIKGNTLVWQNNSVFVLLNGKLPLHKRKGKHNLDDVQFFFSISYQPANVLS